MVKYNSTAFCLKYDIQNVSSTWKVSFCNTGLLSCDGFWHCICLELKWGNKCAPAVCLGIGSTESHLEFFIASVKDPVGQDLVRPYVSPTNIHTDIQLDFLGDE